MADALQTDTAILAELPPSEFAGRQGGHSGVSRQKTQTLRDMFVTLRKDTYRNQTRVITGVVGDDATESDTITDYYLKYTTGDIMIKGVVDHLVAADDQKFIGSAADITAYDLDGTAGTALSADGKTYWAVLVAILVSGAIQLRVVLGAEAADAAEVAVTPAQILSALTDASIAGADLEVYQVIHRFKIQRVATDTITKTFTSTSTDDGLVGERAIGTAGDVVS